MTPWFEKKQPRPTDAEELRARVEALETPRLIAMIGRPQAREWRNEALEIAARTLQARGVAPPRRDACHVCGGELEAGSVSVHPTPSADLLGTGPPNEHCWFRSDETRKREILVKHDGHLSADRCKACGTITFTTLPPN